MAKAADIDILIVPGWSGSGPEHWQTRWERNLPNTIRVEQADWLHPQRDAWVDRVTAAIDRSTRPAVLVAHSLGVITVVHALQALAASGRPEAVAGAFLVTPADIEHCPQWPATEGQMLAPYETGLAPVPLAPLPCPTLLIGSRSDPYCRYERTREFAAAWGATLIDAGDAGHINIASGHGPWPDGLIQFGKLLRHLERPAPASRPTR